MKKISVIGAGMGGLFAALKLAKQGYDVTVFEARNEAGGLASGISFDGLQFDAGPYILLDIIGLEWAFGDVGLSVDTLELDAVEHPYQVQFSDGAPAVDVFQNEEKTIDMLAGLSEFDGSFKTDDYRRFLRKTSSVHDVTRSFQYLDRPSIWTVLTRANVHVPFLLKSLKQLLDKYRLPVPLREAISIWTHIAGQDPEKAPSVLSMVPALIHNHGCYVPRGGIRSIPRLAYNAAVAAGVSFEFGASVEKICVQQGKTAGIDVAGEFVASDAVVSNVNGIATYLELLEGGVSASAEKKLRALPLQSPGFCAYLRVKGLQTGGPFLKFMIDKGEPDPCRLFIRPGLGMDVSAVSGSTIPETACRFIAPISWDRAAEMTDGEMEAYAHRLLDANWWQRDFESYELVGLQTPKSWGEDFNLYRQSMNPVMTAAFMRKGRLRHASPHTKGLYLCGSSTHPGQWVSFCAVSGVHAANALFADMR